MGNHNQPCAARALAIYPRVKGTISRAASRRDSPARRSWTKTHAKRAQLLNKLDKATRETFANAKIVTPTTTAPPYLALIDAADASGDDDEVVRLKHEWSSFLDDAAARTKTPEQRTVYDSHRLTAYLELGTPEKAIPMLEQSERDFPDDYNPPARLAVAYKATKEYDQALAASDPRARARVRTAQDRGVLRPHRHLRRDGRHEVGEGNARAGDRVREGPAGGTAERRKDRRTRKTTSVVEKRLTSRQSCGVRRQRLRFRMRADTKAVALPQHSKKRRERDRESDHEARREKHQAYAMLALRHVYAEEGVVREMRVVRRPSMVSAPADHRGSDATTSRRSPSSSSS
jgi:hypothetical protein